MIEDIKEMFGEMKYYLSGSGCLTIGTIGGLLLFLFLLIGGLCFTETKFIGTGEVLYTSYSPSEVNSGMAVGFDSKGNTTIIPVTTTKKEKRIIVVKMKDGSVLETETDLTTLFSTKLGDKINVFSVKSKLFGATLGHVSNINRGEK